MMLLVSIDFEYRRSNEKHPELVSCVIKGESHKTPMWFWLHESPSERARLVAMLRTLRAEGAVFLAFAATAEARCFLALGENPLYYQWIDLYIETRQIQNKNDRCCFGHYLDSGVPKFSVPPYEPGDHTMISASLASIVYFFEQADLDCERKDLMRKRILEGGPFDLETQREILAYNAQDVEYLPLLFKHIRKENPYLSRTVALRRGRYAACLALTESKGLPIRLDRVMNLSRNQPSISDYFYRECNKTYPFFLQNKKGAFVQSYDQFAHFVRQKGLASRWPKTDSEKFSVAEKTLKQYSSFPEIAKLMSTQKALDHIAFFKAKRLPEFLENVGSDGRIRSWLGPFGTQTGRNAPKAKNYIFAMASWLRAIIEPPPGKIIIGLDYSAQEFAVAAALSNDKNMMRAYNSGDPYLGYAKLSKTVPQSATREDPETDALRDKLKSSCLGIQFGIGQRSLALKMTNDCGGYYSEDDGYRMIRLHQKTFPHYWRFLDNVRSVYQRGECLSTNDGWILFPDNPNPRSVGNFPIQGNAASIGRESMIKGAEVGIEIVAPLHDCDYTECDEKDEESIVWAMKTEMANAVTAILGDKIKIRVDHKIHRHGELWREKKAEKTLQVLGKYLDTESTDDLM